MDKLNMINDYLANEYHKGAFAKIGWSTNYYSSKGHNVIKMVEGYGRLGITYSHISSVQSQHSGLNGEQEWTNNFIIHNLKNDCYKLRITKLVNKPSNLKIKVKYLDLDTGEVYDNPSEIDYLPQSKKYPLPNDSIVFDVKVDNLLYINKLNLNNL